MRRLRTECGTAIVEFVWLAILLLVPLLYVLVAVFETQRAAYAASAAARSASRAFVTAPDQETGRARARAAAALAFQDQGMETDGFLLQLTCRPAPSACLTPGSVVVVEIHSAVALPLVPTALGGNTPSIRVDAVHQSPYGQFKEARP